MGYQWEGPKPTAIPPTSGSQNNTVGVFMIFFKFIFQDYCSRCKSKGC